jgi:hypothetical protein
VELRQLQELQLEMALFQHYLWVAVAERVEEDLAEEPEPAEEARMVPVLPAEQVLQVEQVEMGESVEALR